MNYEKVIVELLGRIQALEEQVAELMVEREGKGEVKKMKVSTGDIREYIKNLKMEAKARGEKVLVLRSGDVHKDLNLKSRLPIVCNAMYQSMLDGDVILHTTPKGLSSTIEIEYKL